jgi:hypothetical protein
MNLKLQLAIQYSTKIDYAMESLNNVIDPMDLEQEWTNITLETVIPSPEVSTKI